MKKMSTKAQMQANGGGEHLAYCVKCDKTFYTKYGTLASVKKAATAHCMAMGGPASGHRYIVLN